MNSGCIRFYLLVNFTGCFWRYVSPSRINGNVVVPRQRDRNEASGEASYTTPLELLQQKLFGESTNILSTGEQTQMLVSNHLFRFCFDVLPWPRISFSYFLRDVPGWLFALVCSFGHASHVPIFRASHGLFSIRLSVSLWVRVACCNFVLASTALLVDRFMAIVLVVCCYGQESRV